MRDTQALGPWRIDYNGQLGQRGFDGGTWDVAGCFTYGVPCRSSLCNVSIDIEGIEQIRGLSNKDHQLYKVATLRRGQRQ